MSYITNGDIEKRIGTTAYIELTDDAGTGSADSTLVDEARLGAEGEANSYLANRYAVPVDLSEEPEAAAALKTFVLDLAAYRLHSRKPPVPDDFTRRRNEAIRWFERIASGTVHLPTALMPPENAALGTLGQADGPPRKMSRETLDNL